MPTVVVRYRPRPDQLDHNEALVRDVFAELAETRPDGLRYATFRLDDGTFVHVADIEGDNPLNESAAFARFQEGIAERCDPGEGPTPQPAVLVGSYELIAGAAG